MREAFRTAKPYLLRYRRGWALGMGALIAKDMCGVAIPLLMRRAIDALTGGQAISVTVWFAVGIIALSAVKGFFQYWMRVILVGISRDVEYDLRNDLFARLTGLSYDFYGRFRTGDIMARATNDLNAVRMMLGPGVMYLLETGLTFVLALAVMLSTDWVLTLLALAPAPLISLAVAFFGRRIHERFEKIQGLFSDISSRVQENIAGVRVVRAYVQEEPELGRFEELNRDYIGQNIRLARLSGVFYPLLQALVGLTFLLVLWVGGRRLLAGELSVGSFVMFNTYMGILVWPMIAFGWVVNLIQRGTASMKRIREILEEQPTITAPARPLELGERAGAIELDGVTLRWPSQTALAGVSLKIAAGETVAIVGRTGSGKSSLAQLIPRIFDPTEGKVTLGGIDLRDLDPEKLRLRIGFVPQETFLFSATLGENIAFGVKDATGEQIRRAAEIAGLGADIDGFPAGYETRVGERGMTLSGGQKQRTAIARALLRDPEVLILDDALSSVDTITEEKILRGLKEMGGERTTVLISHRVSTVRHADCIYVLDHGRVVERGTHDELIAGNGYYADLHQKQLLEEELEAI
jgi:ATP-binding cassette, subfamily B, multidrug efflux pump